MLQLMVVVSSLIMLPLPLLLLMLLFHLRLVLTLGVLLIMGVDNATSVIPSTTWRIGSIVLGGLTDLVVVPVVVEEGSLEQDVEVAVAMVPLEDCVLPMPMKSGNMLIHPILLMVR